jgi:glyoxylate/hydroxypyruvate reductase
MSAFVFITPTWDATPWSDSLRQVLPGHDIRIWPELGHVEDVAYAAAWLPPPNVVEALPNLKVIFSLGAGVDAILADPTLPTTVPIVRVNDPDLTNRMSEYIVLHCLMHLRQHRRLHEAQSRKEWLTFNQPSASAMTVGIMGLGVLGQDAAIKLMMIGFNVIGWSRSPKSLRGVDCYAGESNMDAFLARTDMLVSLLPATPTTDGIINRDLIRKLSRNGPFGAPILINAGRGRQQIEPDIIAALDAGELHAATLDVFHKEPLPKVSPLWSHPGITLTPHNAADSEPATICAYIAGQITRFERGEQLQNLVDRTRGY